MGIRKRKLVRRIAFLFFIVLALILALPLWFPWLARPAAKAFGVRYTRYERESYGRFRLDNVVFTNDDGAFRAKHAVALVPTAWLWRLWSVPKTARFLQVDSWEYIAYPTTNQTSLYTSFTDLGKTFGLLATWLPEAALTNGTIRAGHVSLSIPHATWSAGELSAQLVLPGNRSLDLKAVSRPAARLKVSATLVPWNVQSEWTLAGSPAALHIDGTILWLSNRTEIKVVFPRSGSVPETASVRADTFEIPAARLQLDQYRNLTGSFRADWNTNAFSFDLSAIAFPKSPRLPAINLEARASGTTNAVQIDSLRASAPGLEARLSDSTRIQFSPPFLTRPSVLTLSADLAQQPWFAGTGTLQGAATLFPSDKPCPRVSFNLVGGAVGISNLQTRSVQFEGDFDWPLLKLGPARVEMADGSQADLSGTFIVREKTIAGGTLNYSGSFVRRFLPKEYTLERALLQARFDGPILAINHSAKLEVDGLRVPHGRPMRLDADWTGRGLELREATVGLAAGNSTLQLRGSAAARGGTNEANVTVLTLRVGGTEQLHLERAFHVVFRKPVATEAAATNSWIVQLEPAHWLGDGRELSLEGNVAWPQRGEFRVVAQNLNSSLLNDMVSSPITEAVVSRFALAGGWTNGPVTFALESQLELKTKEQFVFLATARAAGGSTGISIQSLSIASATQAVCHAEGTLPLTIEPTRTNGLIHFHPDIPLRLTAATEPASLLWDKIAEASGLRLREPNLNLDLTGTWAAPQGHIAATVQQIQFPRAEHPLPTLEKIDLGIELNRDAARVSRLNLSIEGQPMRFTAEVPLGGRFWSGVRQNNYLPDWREATAELKVENAELGPFARFAPEILMPQGTVNLDLKLERGGQLNGEATIQNARTRPVATLGPVRSIEAKMTFAGSNVRLTDLSAEIGGQRVTASGDAELSDRFWRERTLPPFQIHVQGTNVPLVRESDVVLRADLDVAITNSAANAIITGLVRLRDGFFLSDLKDLAPGGITTPERRPPYFSIETKPWADWRLAVQVEGTRFLKVRSPLFRGTVSMALKVDGTLRDPVALGEARIDSGAVTFPFGTLQVQQGFVSLTSDDPHRPKLFVTAAAQRLNYDIKMEVTGPADQPVVQFSSSPPLSSEQIVLMLTAGQMPPGLASTTPQQRAQGLAFFVGKNYLSELGIGGDEDRLMVRSGEQVTETGRPTYNVEYKLSDKWFLVGEYDRFSQYNLGLKWKVYSK